MLVKDIFNGCNDEGKIPFSFEFFPPKTPRGWEKLFKTMRELLPLNPAYVSVTYGAGGSTRDNTHDLVSRIHGEGLPVVAHLTCEQSSESEIAAILERYDREGIHNILALKGDVPLPVGSVDKGRSTGADDSATADTPFTYAADLVAYIKRKYPHFGVGVAGFPEGHPATANRLKEMDYLKAKVEAGADYIVTQMFFDNRDFYDYRERCRMAGIDIPIIAGLMPVTSVKGMEKMAELSGGSRFPAALLQRLKRTVNNNGGQWGIYGAAENNTPEVRDAVSRVGEHWTSEQISDLLNHQVAGIHLYTLNNSGASIRIMKSLGLESYSVRG
ncbi:methylenetetrahydrofolate reductase [Salinispira pacifica]|uniref:Methylenetetrahydrofolate reductase n=1 Tax=Salinispira pacifica TaxID=1307761 RepID=V5WL52_9SPIO|nr:methylenetetrahydrofolate reductase [Salinispira pacifica]AHC16537.1 5,10-methylenetetrahydrofolate reductase [Salinispira pacifica]